jgi:hypothetical protein
MYSAVSAKMASAGMCGAEVKRDISVLLIKKWLWSWIYLRGWVDLLEYDISV